MPPNQQKKLKFQTYRIPENRHYFFIQNPWPFDESVSNARAPQQYVNAVIGWLCCMVADLCDTEMNKSDIRVFYQSTHRDLIAEIETSSIDSLDSILGAHNSCSFLTPEYAGEGNCASIIYEYNYVRFNSPEKTNWTSKVATYTSLPPNFAIRHETTGHAYPSPTPSDARKPGVAKPLPGRLILGHPDCMQQTAAPGAAPPPSHAQPVAPLPQQPPPTHPDVPPAAQEQHIPPAASTASRACSPTPPPPPPEADPPSQFAFTPYQRPLNFPRGHQTADRSPSPPTAPQSLKLMNKRDPYEEEADALERLRDTDVAAEQVNAAAPRIKSEEGIKMEEYQPLAGMREMCAQVQVAMRERNADSSSPGRVKQESEDARVKIEDEIKREYQPSVEMRQMHPHVQAAKRERNSTEHREDAEPRVKTETTVKQEDGITEQNFLWEHEREGRKAAVKSENTIQVPVKPEPVDVPMPMPPPPNRRFDPFDGYEPDYGGGSVKREDGAELNTRQPPMSSRYPSSGVKQEEIGQRRAPSRTYSPGVKQEYGSSGYAARDSRTYTPGVKEEYNGDGYRFNRDIREPPAPSAFPGGHSDYPRSRNSSGASGSRGPYPGNSGGYAREASGTFSPSPRPVKRERDKYEDRPYPPPREPPVKREGTEQDLSGSGDYIRTLNPPSSQTSGMSQIRDPRVRARLEREEREREAAKRARVG